MFQSTLDNQSLSALQKLGGSMTAFVKCPVFEGVSSTPRQEIVVLESKNEGYKWVLVSAGVNRTQCNPYIGMETEEKLVPVAQEDNGQPP